MEKEMKEKLSEKYFKDIKIKYLKNFTAKTPNGNIIEGIICRKPNRFLGSMVINKITWTEKNLVFETEQFIQSMPKIHYYDYHHNMYDETENIYPVYEKLDGSCLILYGIYYEEELIEIIPKTRGVPVADSHIINLYNELDHSNIEAYFDKFKETNPTLLFELYGTLNQHSIFYPRTRIDIKLIGGTYDNGVFMNWTELSYLESQFDFVRPIKIFNLRFFNQTWKILTSPGIFFYYLFEECSNSDIHEYLDKEYPTQLDAIQAIKSMVTRINKNYSKKHHRQLLEGVVINSYNSTGESLMYLKVKSADIEEKCRTENGIPRKFILKEVHKYFDEYGSNAKDIYQKDENHFREYVNRNLLEEFDKSLVDMKKTQNRVTNVFLNMLEAKEPPKGLQDICNELVSEYPNTDISDLMRLFAQNYPEKKRQARMAYSIFEKLV